MKSRQAMAGPAALDLLEEAVHLLRSAPARVWLAYYVGAVPFTLGLLFFWADMSCGAFARQRCAGAALGLAVLFLWMKCWQSGFAAALASQMAGAPAPAWGWARCRRLLLVQGGLQPLRLLVLPLALLAMLPFPWVFAFYENLTALGHGAEPGLRSVLRRAAAQARLWPRQNHLLLVLLALLAAVLWLNALVAVMAVPQLLKLFLGIETAFTRAGVWVLFNTTFLAVTVAIAWLMLDPLVKAVYTLRCFYGEARTDGADLVAELTRARATAPARALAAALCLAGLPLAAPAADFTNQAPRISATAVTPEQVDDAVKQTLQQDKYAWRLPRQPAADDDSPTKAWLRAFFNSIGHTVAGWAGAVRDWIGRVIDWFNRHFLPKSKPVAAGEPRHFDWAGPLRWFAYALLAVAVGAFVVLAVQLGRRGWRRPRVVTAEVVPARPDLNDEQVTAAQLPEEEWLKLARELLQGGDARLALRAFYLASLAHLAARDIIRLARFKSNCDYLTEVNRRARGIPELRAAFADNVGAFDRAWYGFYAVTADMLEQFQSNLQRIRSC